MFVFAAYRTLSIPLVNPYPPVERELLLIVVFTPLSTAVSVKEHLFNDRNLFV